MEYRAFGGREVLIPEDVANWYLQLDEADDTAKKAALLCALAHERRLVNDLLIGLARMTLANSALAEVMVPEPRPGVGDAELLAAIREMGAASVQARQVMAKVEGHGKAQGLPELGRQDSD